MKKINKLTKASLIVGILVGIVALSKFGFACQDKYIDNRISIKNKEINEKLDKISSDIKDLEVIMALLNKNNPEYDEIMKIISTSIPHQ